MNPHHHQEKVARINVEIMYLQEDLSRVKTLHVKKMIENDILQKKNGLALLMKKKLDKICSKNLCAQACPQVKTPAVKSKREKTSQLIISKRR